MEESLRERCVYQVMSEELQNQNYTQWFNYVLMFTDDCANDKTFNEECSKRVINKLGINLQNVDRCVVNAVRRMPGKSGQVIPYFEEDREWGKKLGIILHPQITINNITYRG
jgi:hypothetical protein